MGSKFIYAPVEINNNMINEAIVFIKSLLRKIKNIQYGSNVDISTLYRLAYKFSKGIISQKKKKK